MRWEIENVGPGEGDPQGNSEGTRVGNKLGTFDGERIGITLAVSDIIKLGVMNDQGKFYLVEILSEGHL